jgi:hypothetical protein
MSTVQTALERDVASMIVSALNLDTVKSDEIDPAAPLFGAGLGLDSIFRSVTAFSCARTTRTTGASSRRSPI